MDTFVPSQYQCQCHSGTATVPVEHWKCEIAALENLFPGRASYPGTTDLQSIKHILVTLSVSPVTSTSPQIYNLVAAAELAFLVNF
eukprot:2943030-Rhodomonas_salina.2